MDQDASVQDPQQQQAQPEPSSNNPSPHTVPQGAVAQTPTPLIDKQVVRELSQAFGHIPGVPIFSEWEKRQECSNSAVHRSLFAGICGNKKYGAYSIAVSGQYADDEDGGDIIVYTGTGGREKWSNTFPPKRRRLGPQTQDQSWEYIGNSALLTSYSTGNPVRVIRSWKCPSKYAPHRGYRYDGLYIVASCWTATGATGHKICRCRLERLRDQPPIPVRPPTISTSRKRRKQPLSAPFSSTASRERNNSPVTSLTSSDIRNSESLQEHAMAQAFLPDFDVNQDSPPTLQHQPPIEPVTLPMCQRDVNDIIDAAEDDEDEHRTLVSSQDGPADTTLNGHADGMEMDAFFQLLQQASRPSNVD